MITFRDILIFAGLAAFAAAVIATLFPAGEGTSPVPACSDCAFKLTGGYWIRQYGNYAALYLGTREAARYGWAYRADGRPLEIGESATCGSAMYLWVINGIVYASCDGSPPRIGRDVLGPKLPIVNVHISSDLRCTSYTIRFDGNLTERYVVTVVVYNEEGRPVASGTTTIPGSVSFSIPVAGIYRVHIYAPPLLDEWHTLTAQVRITDLVRAQVFTSNNTQDLRPSTSLKIFDLTNYWKRGYSYVTVYMNPWWPLYVTRPAGAFADFLLAWEDDSSRWTHDPLLYRKEVWRLTFTQTDIVLIRVYTWGWRWHEVYVSVPTSGKTLIWTWNKPGPKHHSYTVHWISTTVWIESEDSAMNARATFLKEC
jgi:hypothetical protein